MGAKFTALMILLIGLEISFALFPQSGVEHTALFDFAKDPTSGLLNLFFGSWYGLVAALGFGALVVGSFTIKQDWLWRAGIVIGLSAITFFMVIVHLYQFFYASPILGAYTWVIPSIITIPLSINFIMVILDFISGKD